jgi:bifunctional pyridoxal-dependent enzyme with beta-cystathionase and maltose regulon repressor activities
MSVSLSDDEFGYFVERAVRGMCDIVAELGDEHACTKPDIPGANTPYALLTHCLGVIEYWAGQVNRGRNAHRDRASEFVATGRVADLLDRTERVLAQFRADIAAIDPSAAPVSPPKSWGPHRALTQAGVLMHVYEELAQHHGQMEVLRDALRVGPPPFDPPLDWLRNKRGVKWSRPGPDLIPAWVADMDFPVAAPIRAAVTAMLDRGDLGYPDWTDNPLAQAFAERMKHSFGWAPGPTYTRGITDLIQGLQVLLHLTTQPGDGVLIQLPCYPPFPASIAAMHRRLVPVQLRPDGDSWRWDRSEFELAAADAKVLLLVNPHNPTGRSFTTGELREIADVAEAFDLLVIADEVHAELVYEPFAHVPFASLDPATAARTITLTSATKAYNIAGVRTAVAHVGSQRVRDAWDAQPPELYGHPNTIGIEATLTAWRDCDAWLAGLRSHLVAQRDHLVARVSHLPGISMRVPDAGYLAWLDCRAADLPDDPAAYFREHAGLELAPGPDYDPAAVGWVRLNFGTGRAVLDEILDRMAACLGRRG